MPATIVSANVGGAVAGQVVLPEPRTPSYATWPDVVGKTLSDVTAIYREKLLGSTRPEPMEQNGTAALSRTTLLGVPVLLLLVGALLLFGRKLF